MYTILPEEENPILRDKAHEIPLAEITGPEIRTLILEMKKLLSREEYGVALAAPQVGQSLKIFVVSGRALAKEKRESSAEAGDEDGKRTPRSLPDQVYINPEFVKISRGKKNKHEGCLSIRGKWGSVPRAEKATIRAYDEEGRPFMRGASGFLAHIFQHEMDHLEGVLYTDKATEVRDDENNAE